MDGGIWMVPIAFASAMGLAISVGGFFSTSPTRRLSLSTLAVAFGVGALMLVGIAFLQGQKAHFAALAHVNAADRALVEALGTRELLSMLVFGAPLALVPVAGGLGLLALGLFQTQRREGDPAHG